MKKELSKFIKFPLVLGLVGLICGAALGTVYTVTNPIITDRLYKQVKENLASIAPDFDIPNDITKTFNSDKLNEYKVQTVYSLETNGGDKVGYAYQAKVQGFASEITYLAVVHPTETKFIGFKVISEAETRKGTLQDPNLGNQFTNLSFDKVETDIVYEKGNASKSMQALIGGLTKLAEFHNVNVLGGEKSTIQLTAGEVAKLNLQDGEELVDKTENYAQAMATKNNKDLDWALDQLEGFGILNYLEVIKDSTTTRKIFISTTGEINIPEVGKPSVKLALQFDNNFENSQLIILTTNDTIGDPLNEMYITGVDYEQGISNVSDMTWVTYFNGKTMSEMKSQYNLTVPFNIDTIVGATFVTSGIRQTVCGVILSYIYTYGE